MGSIQLTDYLNDRWKIHVPPLYYRTKNGFTVMWVGVEHDIPELKSYWRIPLPVFTEWWDDQS